MNDPWDHLRRFTAARIALGHAGGSLPTAPLLDFRLSHARAKDAVLTPFDSEALAILLQALHPEILLLESSAADRATYLRRPDLGRSLSEESRARLTKPTASPDLAIILSDGLSTLAVMEQSAALLGALLPLLHREGWAIAPLCIVKHGRVAIQDEIGETLGAKITLMLLGERPGLGSPDSLGAYFTFAPRVGNTDANRNCVSNIRPEGLSPGLAARKLHTLLAASRRLELSGIELKDDTPLLGDLKPQLES